MKKKTTLELIICLSMFNFLAAQETNEKYTWPYEVLKKIDQKATKYKNGECLKLFKYYATDKTFGKLKDAKWVYNEQLNSWEVSEEAAYGTQEERVIKNYYKNVCKYPILIMGIKKEMNLDKPGERFFSDDSFILKPGDSTDGGDYEINETYKNDANDFMYSTVEYQYFMNTGLKLDKNKSPQNKIIPNEKKGNRTNVESSNNIKKIIAKKVSTNRYEINSYTNTTDITINKGNKIYIKASGNVTYGAWAGSGGPDGIEGYTSYNRIQGFRHGSLLFRIGDSEWEAVGESKFIIAKNTGVLQFLVNDDDPSNNGGSFIVDLKITKSK